MTKIKTWAIMPPWGWDEHFQPDYSIARTQESAWDKFCYPSLNKAEYLRGGFKAVEIAIINKEELSYEKLAVALTTISTSLYSTPAEAITELGMTEKEWVRFKEEFPSYAKTLEENCAV